MQYGLFKMNTNENKYKYNDDFILKVINVRSTAVIS